VEVINQLEKMEPNKTKGPEELPIKMIKKLKDTGKAWITSCFREAMKKKYKSDKKVKSSSFTNKKVISQLW